LKGCIRLDKESAFTHIRTMSKVTSKLQVTIPKAVAERHGIRPGDEVGWRSVGGALRIETVARRRTGTIDGRLQVFDQATARQTERNRRRPLKPASSRGWSREEL